MTREGLLTERKAKAGRAIHIRITGKGTKYRERLIEARVAADEALRQRMTAEERETLLRLSKDVAECEFCLPGASERTKPIRPCAISHATCDVQAHLRFHL